MVDFASHTVVAPVQVSWDRRVGEQDGLGLSLANISAIHLVAAGVRARRRIVTVVAVVLEV